MACLAAFFALLTGFLNQCPLYSVENYRTTCEPLANRQYNFIVVGGGTAGATLGSRLTDNPTWRILVIEAGDFPSNLTEVPGTYLLTRGAQEDWQFRTQRSSSCYGTNGECRISQGRCLGGTSAINEMMSIQATQADYDAWFPNGDNRGWDSGILRQYFDRVRATMVTTQYQSIDPLRETIVQGARELNINYNQPGNGYRDSPVSIANSQRWTTAKAYIPSRRTRPNYCILRNTRVTRILFSAVTPSQPIPRVIGVETDTAGTFFASNEVILAAGAINTPKLLMLSGVGPARHLNSLGIPVVRDLAVGQNFQDHIFLPSFFVEFDNLATPRNTPAASLSYCANKRGSHVDVGIGNLVAFLNTRNNSRSRPNIEVMHLTMNRNDDFTLPLFLEKLGFNTESANSLKARNQQTTLLAMLPILLHPRSRGQVLLRSRNPNDPPLIESGYLSDLADVETLLEAVYYLQLLTTTRAFAGSRISNFDIPICRFLPFNTRDYWICNIRNFATSLSHPAGTCKIGPASDPTAVVDNTLAVHGINGLRIADASVMPTILPCNTMIPIVTIAERCLDFINNAMGHF